MCGAVIVTAAARPSPQNRSIATAPLQLYARVLGSGNPVILLGGGLLGADGWGGVPSLLAKTHRVINVQSLPVQYGLDGKPLPVGYELQTEVDALRASLDSTHVDVADIIGMSHGGVTGLVFALENPRRVRTLTLIEPPAFWVLPNHGYDDAGGARDAGICQLAVAHDDDGAACRAVPLSTLRGWTIATASAAMESVGRVPRLTSGLAYDW